MKNKKPAAKVAKKQKDTNHVEKASHQSSPKEMESSATVVNKHNSAINKQIAALDKQMPENRLGDNDALCIRLKAEKEALRKQLK